MRYILVLAAVLFIPQHLFAADRAWDFDASDLDVIEVRLDAGDVRIRGGARVTISLVDADDCKVEVNRSGRTFRLRIEHPRCSGCDDMRAEITLPETVAGRVTTGAGDIGLDHVTAPLTLKTGAGNVEGEGSVLVKVTTGAGNIDLERVTQPLVAKTGAGNVRLELTAVVEGRVVAKTGVGDVRIELPGGVPVEADVSSHMGHSRIDVPQISGSPTVIEASSGVGNVVIHGQEG